MSNISINNVWSSISNEEKEGLLARAQASGIIASLVFISFTTFAAIDFNQYWLILAGVFSSIIIIPLFANSTWRTEKTAKILRYLAVRSVARRYAYGFGLRRLEITSLMQGHLQLIEGLPDMPVDSADFDIKQFLKNEKKPVWICLLQSGLVVISEKAGGAKLEFIANFDKNIETQYLPLNSENKSNAIAVAGNIKNREKIAILTSNYTKTLNSLNNIIDIRKEFSEGQKTNQNL